MDEPGGVSEPAGEDPGVSGSAVGAGGFAPGARSSVVAEPAAAADASWVAAGAGLDASGTGLPGSRPGFSAVAGIGSDDAERGLVDSPSSQSVGMARRDLKHSLSWDRVKNVPSRQSKLARRAPCSNSSGLNVVS
jgi:hypothetical protein